MISDLILETAKVVDINDPSKKGMIQINIESKMANIKKNLLPWAIPLFSNISDGTMNNHLPKVGSQCWILVDKYYKRFYYLSNRYFYNLFDFSKINGLLDKCDKINKDYQNIRFNYYEDGTLLFHNNSDGSSGIITSSNTCLYIDKDGSFINKIAKNYGIEVKENKTEIINKDNELTIKGNREGTINGKDNLNVKSDIEYFTNANIKFKSKTNGIVEVGNSLNTLGSILTELCQDLSQLVTTGTSASQTSPTLTAQMLSLLTKIKMTFK